MTLFEVGDIATLNYLLKVSDVLTDATVTVTVTAPDGTTSTPTPTHAATGSWTANVALPQAGRWFYKWTASGAATDVESGDFTVAAADSASRALTVTASDLSLYMDDPDIDTERADLMLTLASNACTAVLSPLTRTALGVVLAVAARAYENPSGLAAETIGGYSARWSGAGIFLTADERSELLGLRGVPRNRSVVLQLPA